MTSKLTACTLLENWIQTEFDDREHSCATAEWDCQDTEENNETECYFYYQPFLAEDTIRSYGEELCEMLGVPKDCFSYEFDEANDDWRIQVVVSVSVCDRGTNVKLVPEN